MKHSQPVIVVLENSKDVQTMRDASGDVMRIGQAIAHGDVADSPLGRRRYENEIELWEDLASKSLGAEYRLVKCDTPALPAEVKTKQDKKPVKRKRAKSTK